MFPFYQANAKVKVLNLKNASKKDPKDTHTFCHCQTSSLPASELRVWLEALGPRFTDLDLTAPFRLENLGSCNAATRVRIEDGVYYVSTASL